MVFTDSNAKILILEFLKNSIVQINKTVSINRFYEIQKELSFSQIFTQNRCFAEYTFITVHTDLGEVHIIKISTFL